METIEQPTSETTTAIETFQRVLVLVDPDVTSHRALRVAVELRRRFGSSVCVFHVARTDENDHFLNALGSTITRTDLIDEGSAALREFVREAVPDIADTVECEALPENDYVGTIRAKVRAWQPTLIVLSREPRPSLLRRTHAEKLVKSLDVPVLLLEPPPD